MNDVKIHATACNELENLINITENFSSDIQTKFGINNAEQTVSKW